MWDIVIGLQNWSCCERLSITSGTDYYMFRICCHSPLFTSINRPPYYLQEIALQPSSAVIVVTHHTRALGVHLYAAVLVFFWLEYNFVAPVHLVILYCLHTGLRMALSLCFCGLNRFLNFGWSCLFTLKWSEIQQLCTLHEFTWIVETTPICFYDLGTKLSYDLFCLLELSPLELLALLPR